MAPNARVRGTTNWLTSWPTGSRSQQQLSCLQVHLSHTWSVAPLTVRNDSYKLRKTPAFLEAGDWKCLLRYLKSVQGNSFEMLRAEKEETVDGRTHAVSGPSCTGPVLYTAWPGTGPWAVGLRNILLFILHNWNFAPSDTKSWRAHIQHGNYS